MQFIHWLLRATNEKRIEDSTSPTNQKEGITNDQKVDNQLPKHIIVFNQKPKEEAKRGKASCAKKYWKVFLLCRRKDIATSCFHSTINLKSPSDHQSFYWNINYSMKMKKEDIIANAKALVIASKIDQAATHGGNKVLPISETTSTSNAATANDDKDESASDQKKEKSKGHEKGKTMSRMKELLRWAAAAKAEKGGKFIGRKVLQFRNRTSLKAVASGEDDQFSYESPKISFRWDVESCNSTTSSVYSLTSLKNNPNLSSLSLSSATNNVQDCDSNNPARKGNWITTDSEFVVLEL